MKRPSGRGAGVALFGAVVREYAELLVVLIAAAVAVILPGPGRWLADRHGIDVALAALVACTAVGLPVRRAPGPSRDAGAAPRTEAGAAAGAEARTAAWTGAAVDAGAGAGAGGAGAAVVDRLRVGLALGVPAVVLPVAGWLASRLVGPASLRDGMLTVGLAPAEVASVAAVSIAGGDSALAAVLLVGSTLVAVVASGPALRLLAGGGAGAASPDPWGVLVNLAVVVALPLVVGLAVRTAIPPSRVRERVVAAGPVALVTILVWLVASQVVITRAYVGVLGAAVVFLALSTVVGVLLGRGAAQPVATTVLLTTSMRDFAIAAGIATAAFGPASAGPLGLYGVLVIVWGMALAGDRRRRNRSDAQTGLAVGPGGLQPD
ncbi:MAG: arsenite transporter [Acidimicrobiaceae bacterium]|nr:arsenite transporter [Acidimicrobiaceae bacterium]